jgi:hypothetical protein
MMCEAPARQWREFVRPQRLLLAVAALALMAAGIFVANGAIATTIIGLGAVLLLGTFLMPAISQVEWGIPSGVKVVAALQNREENLRRVFENQRPDFELCAKLLCDDPATADELLGAALARATLGWRGPVGPEIRIYVLCWFVHRLMAHSRLVAAQEPSVTAGKNTLLSGLSLSQRIVVVLNEIADLNAEQIAPMVGLSPAQVQDQLTDAKTVLAKQVGGGGDAS